MICAAIGGGTARLARQQRVDAGRMRVSRAVMLWPLPGAGGGDRREGWVRHREHGIQYIFDVTRV